MVFMNNWLFVILNVLFKIVEHDAGFANGGDNLDVNPNSEIDKDDTSNVPKQCQEPNEVYSFTLFQ